MSPEAVRLYAINNHQLLNPRYGGAPYSVHLELVVETARKNIAFIAEERRLDVIAACWAHDLIEGTGVTMAELEQVSNPVVADLVYRVSNELARTRKERNFKTFPKIWENPLAVFIKLCDRVVKGHFSKDHKPTLFNKYKEEYPIFRYALYNAGQYHALWDDLDQLFTFLPPH